MNEIEFCERLMKLRKVMVGWEAAYDCISRQTADSSSEASRLADRMHVAFTNKQKYRDIVVHFIRTNEPRIV